MSLGRADDLIATSHRLATLKNFSFFGSQIRVRAVFESRGEFLEAQSSRCVSNSNLTRLRQTFLQSHPPTSCRNRPAPSILPCRNRSGFATCVGSSGTTLTSGLPALAMMKGSPFAARSTSRDSCVLASSMLKVSITAARTKSDQSSPGGSATQVGFRSPGARAGRCDQTGGDVELGVWVATDVAPSAPASAFRLRRTVA